MRKYIVEFIGTFFLMLVILLSGEPLVIGSTLMVMIFAGGHISGAHFNPAVTLAIWLRGKISVNEAVAYVISQIIASSIAALVAVWLLSSPVPGPKDLEQEFIRALVAEVLGTFALAYVILNVATTRGTSGNSFYGLAIGFTVFVCASALGPFSGGAFNPAVAIGLSITKAFAWKYIWIYVIGCFGGGAIAALLFNYINVEDRHVPPLPKTE